MKPIKPEPEDHPAPVPEAAVKTEVIDDQTAVNEVFRLVQSDKDGISMDHVTALTPNLPRTQKEFAINNLLASKRLVLVKEGTTLKLKVNESTQLEGVTEEEQAVYSLIEESQTKGIWIKELRDNTGLAVSQMRKVLKSLENKKLIKTVKAVGTTKKCYMLTSFEPDIALTGGTFYSDHQLDSELIHTLVSVCTSYLQSKRKSAVDQFPNDSAMQKELSYVRPQDVASYISEKGVLNCQISLEDIERILEVALLDGTIERRSDGKIRATPIQQLVSPLVSIPCGICPMINDCKPGHVISPETCRYMTGWLQGK